MPSPWKMILTKHKNTLQALKEKYMWENERFIENDERVRKWDKRSYIKLFKVIDNIAIYRPK